MEISEMTDEEIREELKANEVVLHHKTGTDKLRSTLEDVRAGTYKAAASKPEESNERAHTAAKPTVDPELSKSVTKLPKGSKMTKEQRAMALVRVIVSPNDPLMATYPGLIFTVGSSAVNNGRMIKKFVPFNNDEGWHIPQIILDQIDSAQMQKFRPITLPNGEKTLQAYLTKKFNVQRLDDLSAEEIAAIGTAQKARGDA
jgi:hypothetical protein